MKKLTKIIIFLIILIIIVSIIILTINKENNNINVPIYIEEKEDNNVVEELKEVTNPHMYLTVKSCMEKYIGYLYKKDSESVYRILDSEYIEEFKISQENVFQHVEDISLRVGLHINEMYVVEKNKNQQEYYIAATLREETMLDKEKQEMDYILTIKLDTKNMIYSVIPYGYGGPLYEKK